MNDKYELGLIDTLKTPEGKNVPFYILHFDKDGSLLSLKTKDEILKKALDYSDIFFFSHGWNNDWTSAKHRYQDFFEQYSNLRKKHNLAMPDSYKPLLVGIFWPSTALVFGEAERGPTPQFNSPVDTGANELEEQRFQESLEEIATLLNEEDRKKLHSLLHDDQLTPDEALQLAELAGKISSDTEGETISAQQVNAQDIVDSWIEDSLTNTSPPGNRGGPQIMGLQPMRQEKMLAKLDPRRILRLLTVAVMKDRAGVVGNGGVGAVIQDLLDHSKARIHLIGHSYGAKVMLSAVSATRSNSRKIHSTLLLQPAISHLAFASSLPGRKGAGGYHHLLNRFDAPIFTTSSIHDFPLRNVFHWALRRKKDLGEHYQIKTQVSPATIPSHYAAMGGYGPRISGEVMISLRPPTSPYELDDNIKIYGLDGSADNKIANHGHVATPDVAWALHTLVRYKMDFAENP